MREGRYFEIFVHAYPWEDSTAALPGTWNIETAWNIETDYATELKILTAVWHGADELEVYQRLLKYRKPEEIISVKDISPSKARRMHKY